MNIQLHQLDKQRQWRTLQASLSDGGWLPGHCAKLPTERSTKQSIVRISYSGDSRCLPRAACETLAISACPEIGRLVSRGHTHMVLSACYGMVSSPGKFHGELHSMTAVLQVRRVKRPHLTGMQISQQMRCEDLRGLGTRARVGGDMQLLQVSGMAYSLSAQRIFCVL